MLIKNFHEFVRSATAIRTLVVVWYGGDGGGDVSMCTADAGD